MTHRKVYVTWTEHVGVVDVWHAEHEGHSLMVRRLGVPYPMFGGYIDGDRVVKSRVAFRAKELTVFEVARRVRLAKPKAKAYES